MTSRRAGQHARETTRRLAMRGLGYVAVLGAAGLVSGLAAGFAGTAFLVAEVSSIAGLVALDRCLMPVIERWDRGAAGEEQVGRIIEDLHEDGWRAIHDVNLGRGNVDHVLVGPAGLITVETKSHRGRIRVDRIDERMLAQAYAQAQLLHLITDRPVAPLLVFSRAYLDRPVSRRRGVVVLPARMLRGHLARRPAAFSADEVAGLHARLATALGDA